MSMSLRTKYLALVEERDTALRQARDLQAKLDFTQRQLANVTAEVAHAATAAAAADRTHAETRASLVDCRRLLDAANAELEAIEKRRQAAAAERAARAKDSRAS